MTSVALNLLGFWDGGRNLFKHEVFYLPYDGSVTNAGMRVV